MKVARTAERTCKFCGDEIPSVGNLRYCSPYCREAFYDEVAGRDRLAYPVCPGCGVEFTQRRGRGHRKFCTIRCREATYRRRRAVNGAQRSPAGAPSATTEGEAPK